MVAYIRCLIEMELLKADISDSLPDPSLSSDHEIGLPLEIDQN
jgi:hypothetical protein